MAHANQIKVILNDYSIFNNNYSNFEDKDYLPSMNINYFNAITNNLNGNECKIWNYILTCCYTQGYVYLSPSDVEKAINVSESTYRRVKNTFLERGYFQIISNSLYEFIPCPQKILNSFKDNYGLYYCIYKLTFPDGKVYIGQTKQNPKDRWANGEGYYGHKVYVPIQEYGWDNVKKEILVEHLSKEEANMFEHYYIREYDSVENGYNDIM